MADLNAVFLSIDVYSTALDKLMGKLDKTTGKMISASKRFDHSAGNILKAGKAAEKATDKMLRFGNQATKTVSKMQKTGRSMDDAAKRMEKTGTAASNATNQMHNAGSMLVDVASSLSKTGKDIGDATKNMLGVGKNVEEVNTSLEKTDKKSKKSSVSILSLIKNMKKMKDVTKVFDLADSLAAPNNRLNAINDGKQTDDELHRKVSAAAGRSRSNYKDMTGYVADLSTSTGNLFKGNDETIAFTELAQRSVVAGGTDDRGAAMGKIIEMMGKGSVSGDELKSVAGTSPLIMAALEGYTGKSGDELLKLADQGAITAETVKNSMFAMSGSINNEFKNTGTTFSETWARLKEGGIMAFSEVLGKLTEFVSSPLVQQGVNFLISGFQMLGDVASSVCGFLIDNWNIIGPILGFIAGVVLVSIILELWSMLPALWAMVAPILAQAAAWLAVNWPILLVVGAITMIIVILSKLGISWQQVFQFIGKIIDVAVAGFYNNFVYMWNVVAAFINFFGNAFQDPIASIKILFLDLALNALKGIISIGDGFSKVISKITGKDIDLTAGLNIATEALELEKNKLKNESGYKEYVQTKDMMDITNPGGIGTQLSNMAISGVENVLDDIANMAAGDTTNPGGSYDPYKGFENSPILPGGNEPVKVEGTGAGGAVSVEMPDEDLEYLRDIAERDYIANVANNSLAPKISVKFGAVHETADANKIAGRIKKILQEEIAMASEGVY